MKHLTSKAKKTLKVLITTVVFGFILSGRAFAACTPDIIEPSPTDPTAQLAGLVCPISTALDVAVIASGAVFVIIIFIGAIKLSLSQGDTKAIEGGRLTVTWGVVGFLIVIGVYTLFNIIVGAFGISTTPSLQSAITDINEWFKNN